MVLAELLTAGNLIDRREQIPVDGNAWCRCASTG
jgi:hypothetical protein